MYRECQIKLVFFVLFFCSELDMHQEPYSTYYYYFYFYSY